MKEQDEAEKGESDIDGMPILVKAHMLRRRGSRTVWKNPANSRWWNAVKNGLFGEIWWKENLRMTRETFVVVCDNLRVHIEKKVTRFREPSVLSNV